MTTLASTALVPALLETAGYLAAAEAEQSPAVNNVQISYDMEAGQATINATLPFTPANTANGLVIEVTDFAPVADFDSASAANFSAYGAGTANAAKFLCRLAEEIDSIELQRQADNQPIPAGIGVNLTVSYDTRQISITSIMPVTQEMVNGKPSIEAVDYLA